MRTRSVASCTSGRPRPAGGRPFSGRRAAGGGPPLAGALTAAVCSGAGALEIAATISIMIVMVIIIIISNLLGSQHAQGPQSTTDTQHTHKQQQHTTDTQQNTQSSVSDRRRFLKVVRGRNGLGGRAARPSERDCPQDSRLGRGGLSAPHRPRLAPDCTREQQGPPHSHGGAGAAGVVVVVVVVVVAVVAVVAGVWVVWV